MQKPILDRTQTTLQVMAATCAELASKVVKLKGEVAAANAQRRLAELEAQSYREQYLNMLNLKASR